MRDFAPTMPFFNRLWIMSLIFLDTTYCTDLLFSYAGIHGFLLFSFFFRGVQLTIWEDIINTRYRLVFVLGQLFSMPWKGLHEEGENKTRQHYNNNKRTEQHTICILISSNCFLVFEQQRLRSRKYFLEEQHTNQYFAHCNMGCLWKSKHIAPPPCWDLSVSHSQLPDMLHQNLHSISPALVPQRQLPVP